MEATFRANFRYSLGPEAVPRIALRGMGVFNHHREEEVEKEEEFPVHTRLIADPGCTCGCTRVPGYTRRWATTFVGLSDKPSNPSFTSHSSSSLLPPQLSPTSARGHLPRVSANGSARLMSVRLPSSGERVAPRHCRTKKVGVLSKPNSGSGPPGDLETRAGSTRQ